jgi:hypothetical protein
LNPLQENNFQMNQQFKCVGREKKMEGTTEEVIKYQKDE